MSYKSDRSIYAAALLGSRGNNRDTEKTDKNCKDDDRKDDVRKDDVGRNDVSKDKRDDFRDSRDNVRERRDDIRERRNDVGERRDDVRDRDDIRDRRDHIRRDNVRRDDVRDRRDDIRRDDVRRDDVRERRNNDTDTRYERHGRDNRDRDRRDDNRQSHNDEKSGSDNRGNKRNNNTAFGGNIPMGQFQEIKNLLLSPEMTDSHLYNFLFPQSLEDRSIHTENALNVELPMLANSNWRYKTRIGAKIPFNERDDQPSVIANHYRFSSQCLPETITMLDVSIYKYPKGSDVLDENNMDDIACKIDKDVSSEIIGLVCDRKPEWKSDSIGFAYDGRKHLFVTTDALDLDGSEYTCDVELKNKQRYFVQFKHAAEVSPRNFLNNWTSLDTVLLRALDSGLSCFARWRTNSKHRNWFLQGTKMFNDRQNCYDLDKGKLVAMRGYNANLKCCLGGTVLVMDISVSAFLRGGPLTDLLVLIGRYRSIDEMYDYLSKRDEPKFLDSVTSLMKSAKIKTTHLGQSKKFKGFGPRCSDTNFVFDYIDTNGNTKSGTIAEYFESKYQLKLKYAALPSVNVGTDKKPQYVPCEVISVVAGQSRQRECQNGETTAQLIKYAAIKPNDRIKMLTDAFGNNGVIGILQTDKNSNAFGFTEETIESKPMTIEARILPPPKLKYANKILEPALKGSWDLKGTKFYKSGGSADGIKVDIVFCGERIDERVVKSFIAGLKNDASKLGIQLNVNTSNNRWLVVESERSADKIDTNFEIMIRDKVDIVFCILNGDTSSWYRIVKRFSDSRGLPSQCMKYSNIERTKPGYNENLLLKINVKTGGVNHTLASRQPSDLGKRSRDNDDKQSEDQTKKVFQDPPNSISWLFNEPCMLLGIDVNHPEVGSKDTRSVASLVGSMDCRLSEYASHVSTQSANCDSHNFLADATENLVKTFKRKNGFYPSRIICFRDGLADSQFNMLEGEIIAIKDGLKMCGIDIGLKDSKTCPISMIVCQKRHNTRLFYRDANGSCNNPCPGLCSDAEGGLNSISSALYNEFYLNSHVSFQGTSRPCKYTLTYDEIGLHLAEIETLAYWSSYLYCRCNKSVSVAAPVLYAHWSAKRGRLLLSSDMNSQNLTKVFEAWNSKPGTSMFYV